jgi:hypothetical protein
MSPPYRAVAPFTYEILRMNNGIMDAYKSEVLLGMALMMDSVKVEDQLLFDSKGSFYQALCRGDIQDPSYYGFGGQYEPLKVNSDVAMRILMDLGIHDMWKKLIIARLNKVSGTMSNRQNWSR